MMGSTSRTTSGRPPNGPMRATTLVARAATGREGLSKVLRYTPLGRGISNCPPCDQNAQPR